MLMLLMNNAHCFCADVIFSGENNLSLEEKIYILFQCFSKNNEKNTNPTFFSWKRNNKTPTYTSFYKYCVFLAMFGYILLQYACFLSSFMKTTFNYLNHA